MTEFLVWNDKWNTGIPEVDEMHMEMTVKLNRVFKLIRECYEAKEHEHRVGGILSEFMEMTREHFTAEEEKMRLCNYPDYANHKKEHGMLIAELVQFIRDLEKKRAKLDGATQKLIKNWFVAHIVIADKAFASYYHALE